ncbi:hypothetical protein D8S78_24000 [Natrialba swarupiae]|nr:hypothetical protein [Natrialba swarupiae]
MTVHAHGPDGPRTIPIDDFFVAMFTTALEDGELLTSVDVPHLGDDDIGVYLKPARRPDTLSSAWQRFSKPTARTITNARVAANGAFGHAMRLSPVEEHLADTPLSRRGRGRGSCARD